MLKTVDKIYTENPFVDELLYWTKLLSLNSIVKDETKANEHETMESLKQADLYIMSLEGRTNFNVLEFSREALLLSSLPEYMIEDCLSDKQNIPESKRNELVILQTAINKETYTEFNTYYRMLAGLPTMGDTGIYIDLNMLPDGVIVDIKKAIHEMNENEISTLEVYGVMQELIDKHPKEKYLNYLGSSKIDPYVSRKAEAFQLISLPIIENESIYETYKSTFEKNRAYILKTIYSEAYKYASTNYDEFIICLIIVQTLVDMITSIQDFIVRKDILDIRSIRYILESNGIPFFPNIPLQFQKVIIKNLNRLLKYKSTTKNKIDIAKIFGFDDIQIFKYYILKDRKRDLDGNYIFELKTDPATGLEIDDMDKMYELKFIKLPIDCDNADIYIKNSQSHYTYDDIVSTDYYWDGEDSHEKVKDSILNKDFSYERTKYIAIDNVYDMTKLLFYMPYLYNMLLDSKLSEEQLKLLIPNLSNLKLFKLNDILCYLFSLSYLYYGINDEIMTSPAKILHVNGFNFEVDMAELSSYVKSKGFTLAELGVDGFLNPKNITSVAQLNDIFKTNKKIYDYISNEMVNADNKRIYDIYKYLYNTLMTIELNMEFFQLQSGTIAATYTDFLQERDSVLFNSIMDMKGITEDSARISAITDKIRDCTLAVIDYLNNDNFRYLFESVPTASLDFVNTYLSQVIDFFNSYKITFLGITSIYKLDYKLENSIKPIDRMSWNTYLKKEDINFTRDKISIFSSVNYKDKYDISDRLNIATYHTEGEVKVYD